MSARNILVINCGSSSIKFALVNEAQETFMLSGLAERLGSPEAVLHWQQGEQKDSLVLPGADHRLALSHLLPVVQQAAAGELHGIGHRVVHGGEHFSGASRLDATSLQAIRQVAPLAPLHNPANLQGIEAAMKLFPELVQVAVFDTAFHQSLPEHAYRYAVPQALYAEHGVRRYGFHGTSHHYVSRQAAQMSDLAYDASSWLVAHLGNGSSTCAVENGHSRDTSMGLTPLEGLVMGTRSGDVDPNLHGHLARTLGWSLERIDSMLNKDSGLLGLSGLSNDMRTLEQAREQGHAGATLAIEVFCYRLAKSLAAMSCALRRLDGLIFTGGIGENSALIRSKTVNHLSLLGLQLDAQANVRCVRGVAGAIHADGHPRVLVVPTNEERQIALDTLALLD
ncbi:acetate kinase [Ectopseudomonas chengduensis]|jgi:acetate kinase|uniref:Acetate kinase n=1 Tax=Ectopseudomonas chengduensis TaxID=489632 RepID=A0A1G6SST1_9GAMM|nr:MULTISPECIES: acetate kinase [Pseudomonas]APU31702.1 propionate/acetate kinase [Pseudomonas alcaliphila JAB1]MBP3062985.1 acetate/propionate family kinase [Pseudomonas chengduensis]NNB76126.1 acetate kinase [Pseudomonas chengduensis]TRO43517.1 acetate kinase [Pseudomonas sp. ALS1279]SDD19893.1 acetate kinase [Pseudomonas chengduensis]|tara:strand:+ start:2562 stop:3746 length:1185 start_codon:yes stop_codon:yes gene_type:complete